jgi:uncharacterized Zn-binding protein involved in type VI secretion
MPPAARLGDMHTCPMVTVLVPHVGGPILPPCCPTVMIGYMPAARVTDMCTCVGPPDMIAKGSFTVLIGNMPAARIGDLTVHGGVITLGCPTVMIGDTPGSALASAAAGVNPTNSVVNCGNIIDAVAARLRGTNPTATAPTGGDGTFTQIEGRFNTTITWGQSFNAAFNQVQAGGDGTMAIIGIQYAGGGSHVVVMANDRGSVGIVEGQNWGPGQGAGVITTSAAANARYNSGGGSNIGIGILPRSGHP